MTAFLTLDIGAGTMDVLYHEDTSGLHYKAVAKSPVVHVAERLASLQGDLLITGCEMGGGPVSRVLEERTRRNRVLMTRAAARTIHHDPERVESLGIRVVSDEEAEKIRSKGTYSHLGIGDIEFKRLEDLFRGLGLPFRFDVVAVCAQDHGVPPLGVSHLDYRHRLFQSKLDEDPTPHSLLYEGHAVPKTLNRLCSIAESIKTLPAQESYVMDSGMAAVLGASLDPEAVSKKRLLVLDVATSHTLGAALTDGKIGGFFEYHTRDITLEKVESLLIDLANGKLGHEQILAEGGHGAYIREAFGFQATELILATGPKRRLLQKSRLAISFGAPWGDHMMTGAVGLLEAVRRRKGLPSIPNF